MKLKKIISLSLAVVLWCSIPFSSVSLEGKSKTYTYGKENNVIESTETVTANEFADYTTADVQSISVIPKKTQFVENVDGYAYNGYFKYQINDFKTLTVYYKDGSIKTYDDSNRNEYHNLNYRISFSSDQSSINPWGPGKHIFTATFMGASTEVEVEVVENPVESISVVPQKTQFVENLDGYGYNGYFQYSLDLKLITIAFKDGSSKVYESGHDVYEDMGYWLQTDSDQTSQNPWGLGKHIFTVTFMGVSTEVEVEVVENPIESIEFTDLYKDTFIKGEQFDIRKLSFKINYKNGTSKKVYPSDFNCISLQDVNYNGTWLSPMINESESQIEFEYLGIKAVQPITILNKSIKEIEVLDTNNTTPDNMKLMVSYSDGVQEILYVDDFSSFSGFGEDKKDENGNSYIFQGADKSFVSTSKGVFLGGYGISYYAPNNVFEAYVILDDVKSQTITSAPLWNYYLTVEKVSVCLNLFLMEKNDGYLSFFNKQDCDFNGSLNKNNIDRFIYYAFFSSESYSEYEDDITYDDMGNQIVPKYIVLKMLNEKLKLNENVDLSISQNYNPETETYKIEIGGYDYYKETNIKITDLGNGEFKAYLKPYWKNNYAINAIFSSDGKIKSIEKDLNENYSSQSIGDFEVKITECKDDDTVLYIPSLLFEKAVTGIGLWVFENSAAERVVLPSTLKYIDMCAFYGSDNLKYVELNEGLQKIGLAAFRNCTSLKSIYIPDSVTEIGDGAFAGCTNLIIFGLKDSYAQQYAKDNDIPFFIICEKSEKNGKNNYKGFFNLNELKTVGDIIYAVSTEKNTVEITDGAFNAVDASKAVGTGCKLILSDDENMADITVIVQGDATGDGVRNISDYEMLKLYLFREKNSSNENIYMACDINCDGVVDAFDMAILDLILNR